MNPLNGLMKWIDENLTYNLVQIKGSTMGGN